MSGFTNIVGQTKGNEVANPVVDNSDSGRIDTIDKFDSKVEVPFSQYSEIRKAPYSAEYFGLDFWKQIEADPKLDVHGLIGKVGLIEKYVAGVIAEHNLPDTTSSYHKVMDIVKNSLHIKDLSQKSIERISEYIKLINKQKELDEKRRKFMEALNVAQ